MDINLEKGLNAKIEKVVETKDTAKMIGSGLAEVFSTPSMIAMMENAAYTAVQKHLSTGVSTVGISISVKHIAATPVGMGVWAEAALSNVDGRKLTFDITAYDAQEKIGEAQHTRFVIDENKFAQKAYAKGKQTI